MIASKTPKQIAEEDLVEALHALDRAERAKADVDVAHAKARTRAHCARATLAAVRHMPEVRL